MKRSLPKGWDGRGAWRARAHQMGLMVTGTAGFLMLAKRVNPSIDLRPELDTLIECNFRMAPALYDEIIKQAR
jgi:predicted nucleic acid-binding protein